MRPISATCVCVARLWEHFIKEKSERDRQKKKELEDAGEHAAASAIVLPPENTKKKKPFFEEISKDDDCCIKYVKDSRCPEASGV